jgi:hypothetical protein
MERTTAARTAQALTHPQRRGLLALAAGNTHVRRDVVGKLLAAGLVDTRRRVTAAGHRVAAALQGKWGIGSAPDAEPVDIVGALVTVSHRAAPVGIPGAVARLLFDLPDDAARVAALAWLAGPDGAGYLGAIKDAFIVSSRAGRTYAQTALHLGISERAVHKAVSRHNAGRQSELDMSPPRGDS